MPLHINKLKQIFASGGTALMCSLHGSSDPAVIFTIADAGADVVFIDLEHFPHNYETLWHMVISAHGAGITPLVRIPDLTYENVTRTLDTGCQTIFVPHVRTGAEIDLLLELARYHPRGRRGMAIYGGGATSYTHIDDVVEAVTTINDNVVLGVNIETREAVENVEDILRDGIDFAIVGSQDLAQTYGIVGQYDHPLILAAKDRVQQLCRERGIAYGVAPTSPAELDAARAGGATLFLYGGVLSWVRRGVQEPRRAIRAD